MTPAASTRGWPELIDDLRRYVRRRVADEHAAEDLVQDTLAKVAARLQNGSVAGSWSAWILRVARNAIVDHYRRKGRAPEVADDVAEAGAVEPAREREGLLRSFRAFVHALPPEQREAVLLTEYEGLSQKQLADRLGIPVSTVKSRVQRGKKRLARALRDCCTFELDRRGQVVDWQRRPGGDCRDC